MRTHPSSAIVPIIGLALVVSNCTTRSPDNPAFAVPPLTRLSAVDVTDTVIAHIDNKSSVTALCPAGMVEIEGDFCPRVEEVCLRWVDIHGRTIPGGDNQTGRCGEFKYPTKCLSEQKVHLHYCIDEYEYPNVAGQKPASWMTWYDAKRILTGEDKRLCTQHEWTFACEGPDMQPYPYGTGYTRDTTACNFDNPLPKGLDVFKAKKHTDPTAQALDNLLVPSGAMPKCVSPFGVRDTVGNIDEWVLNENPGRYPSGLQSGHIFGVRNRCRAITDGHGPSFGWYETGFRGCKDVINKRGQ